MAYYSRDYDYSSSSSDDVDEPYCAPCQRFFSRPSDLRKHLAHSARHNYCLPCDRDFHDANALRQHLASKLHSPPVVFCGRCKSGFVSASALTKHIEVGKCYNLSNADIASRVRRWETSAGCSNMLTVPRIGWHEDGHRQRAVTKSIATAASFDGTCYVCPVCRRGFYKLGSLNQHLSSNVHDSCEFRCWKCSKEFIALSALVAHVESGSCGAMGPASMRNVISNFGKMLLTN